MSYPKLKGPFQILYQYSLEEWTGVGLAYSWEQVDDILTELLTEYEGYSVDLFFIRSMNKNEKDEYWVSLASESPLTFKYYLGGTFNG